MFLKSENVKYVFSNTGADAFQSCFMASDVSIKLE